MKKPLEGLKMLDLTRVLAGPFCGMILADFGVETIKIEVPEKGDDARFFPPFVNEESGYFMSLNRNKKSLTLNLKSDEGRKIFLELVEKADIVLENFSPGTMEKLGIGYEILSKRNPGIIYAACSGYGHSGPYMNRPCYDMIVQAMGGIMSITGPDEEHPYRVGSSIGDIVAGLYSAIGILSALNHRHETGEGQMVDVAMLDCQISILENAISRYTITGENPKPIGNRHPSVSPFGEFKTKDGSLVIAAGNDKLFYKLCEVLNKHELLKDKRFLRNDLRVKNADDLIEIINSSLREKDTKYWLDLLNEAGIPCGPINKISDAINNPQVLARDMIVETRSSTGEMFKMPGIPVKLSKTPGSIQSRAPALGEHSKEILKKYLGYTEETIKKLSEDGVI